MSALGEWDDDTDHHTDVDTGDEPQLFYPDVATFVADFLLPMYTRSSRTWCPQWWRHAEGIYRLEALWRAWEHLRLDPATGASVWLRDHADPHMTVLLSPDGPFKGCNPDAGHRARTKPLPADPPPRGLFT